MTGPRNTLGFGALASIVSMFLTATGALSQVPLTGDFRNTTLRIGEGLGGDIPINVQVDKEQKRQAVGGITVAEGDEVRFDERGTLATQTAGFWKLEQPATSYTILLRDTSGNGFAVLEVKGTVRWSKEREVVEGAENLAALTTVADLNTRQEITFREVISGRLKITVATGKSFSLYNLSPDFSATIAEIQ